MEEQAHAAHPRVELLVREFAALQFEYAETPLAPGRVIGFAHDSVIEISVDDVPATVCLLFGVGSTPLAKARSGVTVATLASVLQVNFTDWLATLIRTHDTSCPWKRTRWFGIWRVSVEYALNDVVILTLESHPSPH